MNAPALVAVLRGLALSTVLAFPGGALAVPISYTISGIATGNVGASAFSNAAYVICISSDTTQITNNGTVWQAPSTTTIAIAGIGTLTVTEAVGLFNNQPGQVAGFWRVGLSDLLDFANPAFGSWGMNTALGPLANMPPMALGQFTNLATTLGAMTMSDSSNVTFQAVLAACGGTPPPAAFVPVPTVGEYTLALLAALLAMAGASRLRRRRAR